MQAYFLFNTILTWVEDHHFCCEILNLLLCFSYNNWSTNEKDNCFSCWFPCFIIQLQNRKTECRHICFYFCMRLVTCLRLVAHFSVWPTIYHHILPSTNDNLQLRYHLKNFEVAARSCNTGSLLLNFLWMPNLSQMGLKSSFMGAIMMAHIPTTWIASSSMYVVLTY